MRCLLCLASVLFVVLVASPLEAAPQDAVVCIPSHGCSGTVISTSAQGTLILSCAHAWEKTQDRGRAIIIDSPYPYRAAPYRGARPFLIRHHNRPHLPLTHL